MLGNRIQQDNNFLLRTIPQWLTFGESTGDILVVRKSIDPQTWSQVFAVNMTGIRQLFLLKITFTQEFHLSERIDHKMWIGLFHARNSKT